MYALVEFKGKQYKAEKDSLIQVDKIDAEVGSTLTIDSVLLLSGDKVVVGTPYVQGARVQAVVENHVRGDKIIVFKYKPKKDYRRTKGHRQEYSVLRIKDIVGA
ncbi:MAG: 50S ribosomal protein L21 [Treponemataceae bacterium]|uniref:50S ribosomal protein L21 n=1 Tax=Treponema sp. J25 TaxID=2094121 RepID=UPI00104E37C0|nr:50S ribosomal protein L21 [Treponema sp. J25]MCX7949637.1 50S ribosomal protein L21 [Treponemataceae bacterium]HOJ98708.1 50S ribosomal protein L21 [Termitinemataceae bacterium]TCW62380.1 50S ribosomal protein L21 [Treponema sp. J25]HOM23469.1 50S ribosomal protein L21 [Termitinemataceae bacterium]HPQ00578.1 50S ribosomal protein L21 [Termitinemataceae bacterium]